MAGLLDFFKGLGGDVKGLFGKILGGDEGGPEGEGTGLKGLFNNKLFLQYLSAMGSDIGSGKAGMPSTNAVTQQNISAQNYKKLLAKMLAGEIPEGGKVTHDADKMTFVVPKNLGGNVPIGQSASTPLGESRAPTLASIATDQPTDFSGRTPDINSRLSNLNPFVGSQSGISAADLAGVSPEMISQALQFKMAKDEFGQKKITDLLDAIYKGAQLESEAPLRAAQTAEAQARAEVLTPSHYVPGFGKMNAADYNDWYKTTTADERTADIKDYEYAVSKGYKGSLIDMKNAIKTADQKEYDQGVAQGFKGSLLDWVIKTGTAKATRISVGEKVGEKIALGEVEARNQLHNPSQLNSLIDKDLNSDITLGAINQADTKEEADKIKARTIASTIQSMIDTGKGVLAADTRMDPDGRTMIWTVKWPDGTVETIRHAIK